MTVYVFIPFSPVIRCAWTWLLSWKKYRIISTICCNSHYILSMSLSSNWSLNSLPLWEQILSVWHFTSILLLFLIGSFVSEILTISRGTLELNLKRSKFTSFWCRRIVFLAATVALLLVFLLHVNRRCCSWWGTPSFLWVLHFRSNWQKLECSYIFCLFIWTAESSYRFYCWDINLNSND